MPREADATTTPPLGMQMQLTAVLRARGRCVCGASDIRHTHMFFTKADR
jgi:hypothetical protein